jgi:hypothetical protein
MDNNKRELYTITWTQLYKEFQKLIEQEFEVLVEETKYKDAKELIDRIKKM